MDYYYYFVSICLTVKARCVVHDQIFLKNYFGFKITRLNFCSNYIVGCLLFLADTFFLELLQNIFQFLIFFLLENLSIVIGILRSSGFLKNISV